jgi:hypothetical protein
MVRERNMDGRMNDLKKNQNKKKMKSEANVL